MCDIVQLKSVVEPYTIANAEYFDGRVRHCVYKQAAHSEVKAKTDFTECSSAAILADTHKVDGTKSSGDQPQQQKRRRGGHGMKTGYVGGTGVKHKKSKGCNTGVKGTGQRGHQWKDCWSKPQQSPDSCKEIRVRAKVL